MGPGYQKLEWFKDGSVFPWETEQGKSRNSILYRYINQYNDLIFLLLN